jgi:hypothetical protein
MSRRVIVAAALLSLTAAACSTPAAQQPGPTADAPSPSSVERSATVEPSPSAAEPVERTPWLDDWEIGARTLPLRPDGYGQRRPTPKELRVRRMPTMDVLPPPPTDEFVSSISRITPKVRERMGTSWEPGCPVGLRDLRYVRVVFHGFDKQPHTGELIVHEDHARGIVQVFRTLYDAHFPIEQMTLPTTNERDRTPSGDGNGTGAMVCRATTAGTSYSAHAYGLAIDVNPFQNPYVRGASSPDTPRNCIGSCLLLPELSGAYLDRSWRRPGMIRPGGVVVRAFADIGWSWGGAWRTLKDYQHFSATGR